MSVSIFFFGWCGINKTSLEYWNLLSDIYCYLIAYAMTIMAIYQKALIHYFPIVHNALCLPPNFCINCCCEILLGGLHIPKSIPQQ